MAQCNSMGGCEGNLGKYIVSLKHLCLVMICWIILIN